MGIFEEFRKKRVRDLISWYIIGISALVGAGWAVFTYFDKADSVANASNMKVSYGIETLSGVPLEPGRTPRGGVSFANLNISCAEKNQRQVVIDRMSLKVDEVEKKFVADLGEAPKGHGTRSVDALELVVDGRDLGLAYWKIKDETKEVCRGKASCLGANLLQKNGIAEEIIINCASDEVISQKIRLSIRGGGDYGVGFVFSAVSAGRRFDFSSAPLRVLGGN